MRKEVPEMSKIELVKRAMAAYVMMWSWKEKACQCAQLEHEEDEVSTWQKELKWVTL